jgi:hypothetical protein
MQSFTKILLIMVFIADILDRQELWLPRGGYFSDKEQLKFHQNSCQKGKIGNDLL